MSQQAYSDHTQLNAEIAELEAEVAQLGKARRKAAASRRWATIRMVYLRAARWVRLPTTRFEQWPMFALLFGPLLSGVVGLILFKELTGSWSTAFIATLLGAILGGGLLMSLLFRPPDAQLPELITDREAQLTIVTGELRAIESRLGTAKARLAELIEARRQLIVSGKLQRAALLQRNWKAMRDEEWEDYLVEVCRTLGAKVQRTGRSGDQGVDLIAEFGPRRVAIQAKGYYHAVNSAAVQQAVAGVAHYGCNASAVITNSRFTKGALELAASNNCVLIGEDKFPDFVLGNVTL